MIANGGGGGGADKTTNGTRAESPTPGPSAPGEHSPADTASTYHRPLPSIAAAGGGSPFASRQPSGTKTPAAAHGLSASPASISSISVSTGSAGKPPLPGKASTTTAAGASTTAATTAVATPPRAGQDAATPSPGGGVRTPSASPAGGGTSMSGGGGGSSFAAIATRSAVGNSNGGANSTAGTPAGGGGAPGVELALSRAGLVAVLDLCVALYKFVNVELHSQGWYAVRVRVLPGQDAVCTAHTVVQSQAAAAVGERPSGQGTQQAGGAAEVAAALAPADPAVLKRQSWSVEEGGTCFRSSIFRIRYCYEEVKLQTAVMMQVVVTNLQALSSLSLTFEFELLFQEANLETPYAVPEEFHLRSVARETVTLAGLAGGLAEYYGCTFSDEHFGLASCGLFAGLAGFATKDAVDSGVHRTVSSNWLCSLVGDGRKDGGQHLRTTHETDSPRRHRNSGSGLARSSPSPTPSPSPAPKRDSGGPAGAFTAVAAAAALGGAGAVSVSRVVSSPGPLDFGDQELRKKVIRLLHQVVEAPSVRQGSSYIPTEAERQERLAGVYDLLVAGHCRSRDTLTAALRAAPPECFAPQTLDVLRALLASAHTAAAAAAAALLEPAMVVTAPPTTGINAAGGGARAAASSPLRGATPRVAAAAPLARLSFGHAAATAAGGGGAADTTYADVPPSPRFRAQLRDLPTTADALHVLDGLLVALSRDSRTDWAVLGWVLRTVPRELMRHLKLQWEQRQPDAVMPFLLWDSAPGRDIIAAKAAAHRQELRMPSFQLPAVRPGSLWGSPGDQPVLVVDDSQGIKWLDECETYFGKDFKPRDETHVAIFVHGFQGASTDLCLVKAHLMLMYPYLECYSSKTNEGNTHDSIQDMGKRLAVEIAEVLAPFTRSTRRPLGKITLVGHSIGNLILRAALTMAEFRPYKHLLWLYVSVCGPHLGFLYGTNAVVDTGLMLLKSIGKGKCLHQLTFSDASQLTDCYLYRLAHDCPLSVFKLAVVVSSPQDRYVPYHSSSLTTCPQAERDSRRGRCYAAMLRAMTAGVGRGTHLFRLGVDFSLRTKGFSFSKLVGRTAHIEFIESQLYVGLMMWGLVHRYTMLAPSPHSWL